MTNFKTRIKKISKEKGKIILANDYDVSTPNLEKITIRNIKTLNKFLCGLKINFHLLLPLSEKQIIKINSVAHDFGLQTIADIKLNDIGNTNRVTTETLWNLGFDAAIVNPIMGLESLGHLIKSAHKSKKGIITLCHMSAPQAKLSYEMHVRINNKSQKLYQLFLDWAISQKADGVIVGATYPEIIKFCKNRIKNKLYIFSPGVGTQGGTPSQVISAGSDFLIVGRSILNSDNPGEISKKLQLQSILKN